MITEISDKCAVAKDLSDLPRAMTTTENEAPPVESLRILVAEDTPANQYLLVRLLTGRGHQVRVAEDGVEAVKLFANEPFDVVLMDLHMPNLDGFQASSEIRELERARKSHVPIVAVTAYVSIDSRARCLEAGIDTFVPKPINIRQFIDLIEQFPRRHDSPISGNPSSPGNQDL